MSDTIKENAKEFPKMYYCRHMLPGVAAYNNENLYVDADAMKNAAPSMVGKPVYVHHQKVDIDNIHEADGFVVECFYNELDGWEWAKFLAVSDAAQSACAKRWSVSNAYNPIDWDGAGQHLNVDYDRKIRNYEFTHLAIVPNPRYEEAKIFTPDEFKAYQAEKRAHLEELQNSKPSIGSFRMFFRQKKEEVKAGDKILDTDFTEVKNDDGSMENVTVAELIEKYREQKKLRDEITNKKNDKLVGDDEEVDVDGEKVNMGALKECYSSMKKNEKKNAEDEAKKKEEDDKEKENAEEEAKKKAEADEKEKTNAKKNLEEIANAHNRKAAPRITDTMMDKAKRGADRYSFNKKAS